MGIQLTWENDAQSIMRCEFEKTWTWDDLYVIADQVKKVTDAATHEIAAIIDLSSGVTFPGGNILSPTSLENARKMLTLGEGGTGPIVVVGATKIIQMAYDMFKGMDKRAASADITFVDTLEAAHTHLAKVHDPTRRKA
jgi:hypothetical protein